MGFFDGMFSIDFQRNGTWAPANHFAFQMANIFLVISYFVNPTSKFGLLMLRFTLMMAALCFAFWGAFILRSLDTLIWNLAFALGNLIHLVYVTIRILLKKSNDDDTEDEHNSMSLLQL